MEVSNVAVLKTLPTHMGKTNPTVSCGCLRRDIRLPRLGNGSMTRPGKMKSGFEDKGHLDYYNNMVSPVCGDKKGKGNKSWKQVSSKKKIKLLKSLVNDLGAFSDLGFGFEVNSDDEKTNMISEAADKLLVQLKQLRSTEAEIKQMQKLDRKKSKSKDSSSSSSSESSDSECDSVVDMNRFRNKAVVQPVETCDKLLLTSESLTPGSNLSPKVDQQCCNMILEATLNQNPTIEVLELETPSLEQPKPTQGRKIEVCMGGKCKKLGALALMDEFRKVVGEDEASVVGCKCMGKCKSSPNVRVSNTQHDSVSSNNPLYIGVGLEDVELIVANCFGHQNKSLGLALPALH